MIKEKPANAEKHGRKEKIIFNADFEKYLEEIAERVGKSRDHVSRNKHEERRKTRNRIINVGMAILVNLNFVMLGNVAKASDESLDFKNSAGIAVTRGEETNEVLSIININQVPEGRSYGFDGSKVKNGFSLQLNLFAKIGEGREEKYLWLQNVRYFEEEVAGKWKSGAASEIFRFTKISPEGNEPESALDSGIKPYLQAEKMKKNQVEGGNGTVLEDIGSGLGGTYNYRGKLEKASFPIHIALDIKVMKIDAYTVEVDYNSLPIENGILEWQNETRIDSIRYHEKDIGKVNIVFGNDTDAAMVVAGEGGSGHFVADKFDAEFSMYAVNRNKILTPLKISGTTDPTTGEGIAGVNVQEISTDKVRITATHNN